MRHNKFGFLDYLNAYPLLFAQVAQLVEHIPEEDGVAGSSPALSTAMQKPLSMDSGFCIAALRSFSEAERERFLLRSAGTFRSTEL